MNELIIISSDWQTFKTHVNSYFLKQTISFVIIT